MPPAPFGFAYVGLNVSSGGGSVVCGGSFDAQATIWPKPKYSTSFEARVNFSIRVGRLVLLVNVLKLEADAKNMIWDPRVPFELEIQKITNVSFPCPRAAKALQDVLRFDVCGCVERDITKRLNSNDLLKQLSGAAQARAEPFVRSKILDVIRSAV